MGAISTASGTQATTISTEHTLTTQTGVGAYQLEVDTSDLDSGDVLKISVKTKTRSEDSLNLAWEQVVTAPETIKNINSDAILITTGQTIECSITQTSGVSSSISWNLKRA